MQTFLDEKLFELLDKCDLDEELDPGIDGDAVLYEDAEFSTTPQEADSYRTTTEKVLGFELNGNQVQYLASSWPEFYHNAEKYASMKDQIIGFMKDEDLVSEDAIKFDDIDDIDYIEDNPDALHPVLNNDDSAYLQLPMPDKPVNKQFTAPMVKSWDQAPAANKQDVSTLDDMQAMADEDVDVVDDDFSDISDEELNKILSDSIKQ